VRHDLPTGGTYCGIGRATTAEDEEERAPFHPRETSAPNVRAVSDDPAGGGPQ
jgi:hypothetical protein